MIERFRLWLSNWLSVDNDQAHQINKLRAALGFQQTEIKEIRAEVTRLLIAQYRPPETPELPKRKVITTTTFKQYSDILEREQAEQENSDALR